MQSASSILCPKCGQRIDSKDGVKAATLAYENHKLMCRPSPDTRQTDLFGAKAEQQYDRLADVRVWLAKYGLQINTPAVGRINIMDGQDGISIASSGISRLFITTFEGQE